MKAAFGVALLAVGCAEAPALTAADVHPSLRCLPGVVEAPIVPLPAVAAHETPTPGQMTEEAAQAKRLLDSNRWAEAAIALGRVADGETGDDEGNREIAAYQRGIALLNDRKRSAAVPIFLGIAANHQHNKWNEAVMWLFRLASDANLREQAFRGLAEYVDEATEWEQYRSPSRSSDYREALRLVLGKIAYRNGDYDSALTLHGNIRPRSEPMYSAAQECIVLARKKRSQ